MRCGGNRKSTLYRTPFVHCLVLACKAKLWATANPVETIATLPPPKHIVSSLLCWPNGRKRICKLTILKNRVDPLPDPDNDHPLIIKPEAPKAKEPENHGTKRGLLQFTSTLPFLARQKARGDVNIDSIPS